jgi:hypothetical protein
MPPWLSPRATVVLPILFVIGSFLAWYLWTQIARPLVFHVPPYNPPPAYVAIAVAIIAALCFTALGPMHRHVAHPPKPLNPPSPIWLGFVGGLAAVLWYGLVLLGFGIAPRFPPSVAVVAGLSVAAVALTILPRWAAHTKWRPMHQYSIIAGVMVGSMTVGYVGFIGATALDLYGKVILNLIAVALLIVLGVEVRRQEVLTFDIGSSAPRKPRSRGEVNAETAKDAADSW